MKPKAKYRYHAAMLFFCMQQNITSAEGAYFSKHYYHTPFLAPTLCGTRVATSSQDRERERDSPHKIITGCRKLNITRFWWFPIFTPNFVTIGHLVQKMKWGHNK
jgi:hypothetical protein